MHLFEVTLHSLLGARGVPEARYSVAWRCGEQQGKTHRCAAASNGEVTFGAKLSITAAPDTPSSGPLLELHVKEYLGDSKRQKRPLGVLCLDLAKHLPPPGVTSTSPQSATLPLSHAAEAGLKLCLAVKCSQPGGLAESETASLPTAPSCVSTETEGGELHILRQKLRELSDENTRLSRQNDSLQREGGYTYTNNPSSRSLQQAASQDGEIARLRREVDTRGEELRQSRREVAELESALQAAERRAADAERIAREAEKGRGPAAEVVSGELTLQLQDTVDALTRQLEATRISAEAEKGRFQAELAAVSGRAAAEGRQLRQQAATAGDQAAEAARVEMQTEIDRLRAHLSEADIRIRAAERRAEEARDEAERDKEHADQAHSTRAAAEDARAELRAQVEALQTELGRRDEQQSEERQQTEQAKDMLCELMERVKELQAREEEFRETAAAADGDRGLLREEVERLKAESVRLQAELAEANAQAAARIRSASVAAEESAVAERARADSCRLDAQRLERELASVRSELGLVSADAEKLRELCSQRKERIGDLKRIVSLHMQLRLARGSAEPEDNEENTAGTLLAAFGEAAAEAAATLRRQ
eukprot:Hpha_TRINITY_DN16051_c4_g3::TRINITY_DN16051_c4_g3_i1::g.120330::m.120330